MLRRAIKKAPDAETSSSSTDAIQLVERREELGGEQSFDALHMLRRSGAPPKSALGRATPVPRHSGAIAEYDGGAAPAIINAHDGRNHVAAFFPEDHP